jgi:hypothetical protein
MFLESPSAEKKSFLMLREAMICDEGQTSEVELGGTDRHMMTRM